MRIAVQITVLVLLSLAGAAFSAGRFDRPVPISDDPWARAMTALPEAEEVIWVDARPPAQYLAGHIPGAVNVSLDDWEDGFGALLEVWTPERAVVAYCDGDGCALSREVAERLRADLGAEDVYWLDGGLPAWREAGGEVSP